MTVGCNTKDDLVDGEAGSGPLCHGTDGTALLVGHRGTGVVEGSVGTDGLAPGAPDVVVHDGDPVEVFGESGHI